MHYCINIKQKPLTPWDPAPFLSPLPSAQSHVSDASQQSCGSVTPSPTAASHRLKGRDPSHCPDRVAHNHHMYAKRGTITERLPTRQEPITAKCAQQRGEMARIRAENDPATHKLRIEHEPDLW